MALEAGNSPQMIFRHYRELATPEQARTWFAIAPEAAPNVVPTPLRAASDETKRARGAAPLATPGGAQSRYAHKTLRTVALPEKFMGKKKRVVYPNR